MPYPTYLAATLSGASIRQLQYWRESELLVPEFGMQRGRLAYSFRDVLALRTFVYLREGQSLARIRTAIQGLRDLGNVEHVSMYKLLGAGSDIVLREEEGTFISLVVTGQKVLDATMAEVLAPFANRQGARVVDFRRPRPKLTVDPDMLGGYPVVAGTRIEFDLVSGLVEDGVPLEEVSDYYPSVSAEAAADAASFSRLVDAYRSGRIASAA